MDGKAAALQPASAFGFGLRSRKRLRVAIHLDGVLCIPSLQVTHTMWSCSECLTMVSGMTL